MLKLHVLYNTYQLAAKTFLANIPDERTFKIGSIVLCNVWRVALGQDHNFLLDVLDLIFSLLEINDLDGHDPLTAVIETLVDLTERTLANALLLREDQFRVHFLRARGREGVVTEHATRNTEG